MSAPISPADLTFLYRFAVALAGLNEEAEQLLHEVLEEKLARLAEAEPQKRLVQLLQAVWREKPEPRGDGPISNLPPQFQWLKTPERAVATLRGFGRFSEQEIELICGGARVSENPLPAEKTAAALDAIPVSPELLKRLAVTIQGVHPPFRLLSPLGFSLVFASLVLCAVAVWIWSDWQTKADEVLAGEFFNSVSQVAAETLEPVDERVGELTDVLFLKFGLENYPLPAAFADRPAAGVRVAQINGHPVVQIGLKNAPGFLLLFRAEDFGLGADEDAWQVATEEGRALALRSQNQQGQAVVLQGGLAELRQTLPK